MIVVRLSGGLGNQMFQYALGRRLAMKNGAELLLDVTYFDYVPRKTDYYVKREFDLSIFETDVKVLDPVESNWLPCHRNQYTHQLKHLLKKCFNIYKYVDNYHVLRECTPFSFDERILNAGENTYLIGFWQNPKYFKDVESQIRRDFTFKNHFGQNVTSLAQEITSANSICINVRRGDFVNNPTHGSLGVEYIAKALNYLCNIVDVGKIYIFSDEIDWCIKNIPIEGPHRFVTHDYAGRKFSSYFYLMTRCRHFIIPNSTFGWWAAWLADAPGKFVIAPKQWVNVPGLDASGIMPEGWVTL